MNYPFRPFSKYITRYWGISEENGTEVFCNTFPWCWIVRALWTLAGRFLIRPISSVILKSSSTKTEGSWASASLKGWTGPSSRDCEGSKNLESKTQCQTSFWYYFTTTKSAVPVNEDLDIAKEEHTLLSQFLCLIMKTARLTWKRKNIVIHISAAKVLSDCNNSSQKVCLQMLTKIMWAGLHQRLQF